jgi:hypothetical protein
MGERTYRALQARITTLVTGVSGLYLVHEPGHRCRRGGRQPRISAVRPMLACRLRVAKNETILFKVAIAATANLPRCSARYMLDCQDLT